MIGLDLTAEETRAFRRTLRTSHEKRAIVRVYDRNEKLLEQIRSPRLIDGAVHVDETADVSRTLELEIVAAGVEFVPNSPKRFGVFADNFLGVSVEIYSNELAAWVEVPVFRGPISEVEFHGETATIDASGKDSLGIEPAFAWNALTIHKGTKLTAAIREILASQGETRFDLPDLDRKLRRPVSVGRLSEPWKIASRLARSADRQLLYDAEGRAKLRAIGRRPVLSFEYGVDVVGEIRRHYSLETLRNVIEALGPDPEGKKDRLRFVAIANHRNPLNPYRLARNGSPRFLVERIELEHASRLKQVREAAERTLEDRLRGILEIEFVALPQYDLEPGDLIQVRDEAGATHETRLDKFTLPLGAGTMTIGFTRKLSRRRKRKRHKR